jgi:transcriptional regulator with XRE-family HTH domain
MTTGEKIKARRKELGMTTEELGKAIGVQRSAITKYEKDRIDLKSERIQQIAKALLVPVVDLLPDDPAALGEYGDKLLKQLTDLIVKLNPDQKRQALNVLNAMFSDKQDWIV